MKMHCLFTCRLPVTLNLTKLEVTWKQSPNEFSRLVWPGACQQRISLIELIEIGRPFPLQEPSFPRLGYKLCENEESQLELQDAFILSALACGYHLTSYLSSFLYFPTMTDYNLELSARETFPLRIAFCWDICHNNKNKTRETHIKCQYETQYYVQVHMHAS